MIMKRETEVKAFEVKQYCDNCGEEIDPDYAIKDGEMEYCDDCAEELGLLKEEETVNE